MAKKIHYASYGKGFGANKWKLVVLPGYLLSDRSRRSPFVLPGIGQGVPVFIFQTAPSTQQAGQEEAVGPSCLSIWNFLWSWTEQQIHGTPTLQSKKGNFASSFICLSRARGVATSICCTHFSAGPFPWSLPSRWLLLWSWSIRLMIIQDQPESNFPKIQIQLWQRRRKLDR